MLLIAGLGNPGDEYKNNRHNVGFMVVDAIHRSQKAENWRNKFDALIAKANINNKQVMLVKPQTYMNDSGVAIGQVARFYKIQTEDVVVIHDEIDIKRGDVRAKIGGGSAGHNGIKSIDQHIGNKYRRIRIGVGRPITKQKVFGYVLGNFQDEDSIWLNDMIERAANNVGMIADGDDKKFAQEVSVTTGETE